MYLPDDVFRRILDYRRELCLRDFMKYRMCPALRMAARRRRYARLATAVPWPAGMPDGWPPAETATEADFDFMDTVLKRWQNLCRMV